MVEMNYPFNHLVARWTDAQQEIRAAFASSPITVAMLPRSHGASTLIAGLAIAQAMCGKHVLIVEPNCTTHANIMGILERLCVAPTVRTFCTHGQHLEFAVQNGSGSIECRYIDNDKLLMPFFTPDSILIDNATLVAPEIFYKNIMPVMQVAPDAHVLAIGTPTTASETTGLIAALNQLPADIAQKICIPASDPTANWHTGKKAEKLKELYLEATAHTPSQLHANK
jgi:hypothetical protein